MFPHNDLQEYYPKIVAKQYNEEDSDENFIE